MRQGFIVIFVFVLAGLLGTAAPLARAQMDGAPANPNGFQSAMSLLASGNKEAAVRQFWQLALQGDVQAQYYLAYMLDNGVGVAEDVIEAARWYLKAAERRHLPSMVAAGYIYSIGRGIVQDDVEAVKWFHAAAVMGDPIAQNNLATLLREGRGVEQKKSLLAAQWYMQAAMQGNVQAQYNLATMYRVGEGIKKNEAEALRWYLAAAAKGDKGAERVLGYMYRSGKGVEANDKTALYWYRRAAEKGDVIAQFAVASMYEEGKGDPGKGVGDASIWYLRAAEQGNARAQHRLGYLYENGAGVPKSIMGALKWYKKAAVENSYPPAKVSLAHLYEVGASGSLPRDLKEAARWYQEAAGEGDAVAQFEAGRVFNEGIGVEKNMVTAYKWYSLAALALPQGPLKDAAIVARISTANSLSEEQLVLIRQEVAGWRPQNNSVPRFRSN